MHWVIDLDLRKYFDTIPHLKLRKIFSRRIRDGVINKLLLGWLKAGVLLEEKVTTSHDGTPPGGTVSPLLSNFYLHELLGNWFADDAVLCFQH